MWKPRLEVKLTFACIVQLTLANWTPAKSQMIEQQRYGWGEIAAASQHTEGGHSTFDCRIAGSSSTLTIANKGASLTISHFALILSIGGHSPRFICNGTASITLANGTIRCDSPIGTSNTPTLPIYFSNYKLTVGRDSVILAFATMVGQCSVPFRGLYYNMGGRR
jgi:hypothetical protein